MIIACLLYNIYNSTKQTKTNNPIANIELSSYIFDKYGSKLNTDFINKTLNNNLNNNLNIKDLNIKDLNIKDLNITSVNKDLIKDFTNLF